MSCELGLDRLFRRYNNNIVFMNLKAIIIDVSTMHLYVDVAGTAHVQLLEKRKLLYKYVSLSSMAALPKFSREKEVNRLDNFWPRALE